MTRYVDGVTRFRGYIIAAYLLLFFAVVAVYHPRVLSSDAMFWLKDSAEMQRSEANLYTPHLLSKLTVHVDTFDETTREALHRLNDRLMALEGVDEVYSLFSKEQSAIGGGTEMVGVVSTGDLDTYRLEKLVKERYNAYGNVVDADFKTFRFFISAQSAVDIGGLEIPGSYSYTATNESVDWPELIRYGVVLLLTIFMVFRFLFRNYISAISAVVVITLSTLFTFALIYGLTGINAVHMTMPFITISIVLVDFLFFYYRWHVSQYKIDKRNALIKMLNRSSAPALWTSVITTLGLGSLLFIDSDIIRLLCLGVIFSSIVGYLINLTFLPALLSYFELEHTHIPYAKMGYFFASSELHYNRKFLHLFLGATFGLMVLGGSMIYGESSRFFNLNVVNDQIQLKIPYARIDLGLIRSINRFTEAIGEKFGDGLGEVVSLATIVQSLNDANSQTGALDDEALMQALFYLDLYGMQKSYYDADAVNIRINLFDVDKLELIDWLARYSALDIYFVDKETLLDSAKFNKTLLLSTSLFSALLVIGLITGWIFRSVAMVFVGFIVNAVPIAWFGLLVRLLDVPLSLEMLIAMTIAVGLASDATIHFAYKYFRARYIGRSRKHALEKMYFYSGIPVIIGSAVLIAVFSALYLSSLQSLQLIGLYSAVLVFISLLTDLFVLPVMLLFIDRFDRGI
ncbi:MMPL family transporter [Thiomicrolovo sp. ZZH C-3]